MAEPLVTLKQVLMFKGEGSHFSKAEPGRGPGVPCFGPLQTSV